MDFDWLLNKENIPYYALYVSITSFLGTIYSSFLLRRSNKNNIYLNNELSSLNQKKHWRNEKIYNLSEDLQDLANRYWLSDANDETDPIVQLQIKSKLQDIEDHSISISIDITSELTLLRDNITGGLFESPERKKISSCHLKFLLIQQSVSSIKSKLP